MPSFIAPNTMRTFTFDGIVSSTYFLTKSIKRDILPPINVDTVTVPSRHGAYAVRSRLGVRTFTIDIQLMEDSYTDLRAAVREIASWLFKDQETALSFSDEPDKYYLARLSGDTDLDEVAQMGEGSLTFIATDPIAYSVTEKNQLHADYTNGSTYVNNGTAETYPRLRIVPSATISYIQATLGTKYVYVEGPFNAGEVVIIDMDINSIYMESTGARIMDKVTIESDFWGFDAGNNLVQIAPSTGLSCTIYWRERWL